MYHFLRLELFAVVDAVDEIVEVVRLVDFIPGDASAIWLTVLVDAILVLDVIALLELDVIDFFSFFFACPNSTFLQRDAKFNEHSDSLILYTAGEILTNISTLELPPSDSYIGGVINQLDKYVHNNNNL